MLRKTTTVLGVALWGVPSYVFRVQPMSDMCFIGRKALTCVSLRLSPMALGQAVLVPEKPKFTLRKNEDKSAPGHAKIVLSGGGGI